MLLKYFVSYYFQEKIWECFKVQLSVVVFVFILSSKGANQLQVFYKSCGPQMYSQQFFSGNLQKF